MDTEVVEGECAQWDLEKYEVPAAIRKILKKTKPNEFVQITVEPSNCKKLLDHLPDPHGIWDHKVLAEGNLKITIQCLEWEQKDYLFRLPIADKIVRVKFLKEVSSSFFKVEKYEKATKIYSRIK